MAGKNGPTSLSGTNDGRADGSSLGGGSLTAGMAVMVADGQSLFLMWKHVEIQYQGSFGSYNKKVEVSENTKVKQVLDIRID